MPQNEKWDEPDVRRDFRRTRLGYLLVGAGIGLALAGLLISLFLLALAPLAALFASIVGSAITALATVYSGSHFLKTARSVKVSGTYGVKGGWRKRRL